jgi:hypothetical protein
MYKKWITEVNGKERRLKMSISYKQYGRRGNNIPNGVQI